MASSMAMPIRIEAAASMLPHPEKANTGGEDAFFLQERASVFGVFDGVGGWASQGVDAGAFSRALSENTAAQFSGPRVAAALSAAHLKKALDDGLRKVKVLGSCTACLACVDCSSSTLSAINLGDSGFRLFRSDGEPSSGSRRKLRLETASRSQQHYFNCPLQLGGGSSDRPRDADPYTHSVQPGDLVLLATDGVLDNLFDDEIAELLSAGGTAQQLSARVAKYARQLSFDHQRRSPFTVEAERMGISNMLGGKVDDVTVLLLKVVEAAADPEDEAEQSQFESQSPRSKL